MRYRHLYIVLLTASLAAAARHDAFADAATEAQLRAALQGATAQIAQLEDQVANLQASQAPEVATIEALRAQLQTQQTAKPDTGSTETAAKKAKNDAELAALKHQLATQGYSLSRSQTAYQSAANAAGSATQENTALKTQLAALNAGLGSCNSKNAKLYALGNQVLDAYSHEDDVFGALANREPFTGIKRVQLQNIVQDDLDVLYDNKMTPAAGP